MYAEFATDPKVQSMTEAMQRRLSMLFCFQCTGDLAKLSDEELAMAMRISMKELQRTRETFVRKGFISGTWEPKNWDKRQAPKDRTAAERMARIREHRRNQAANVARNVAPTLRVEAELDTETDTECVAPRARTREEPPYPDPERSPLMIAPGPHEIDEETARKLWSLLWQGWKDEAILAGFYQRQRFYKPESWREAIRSVAARKVIPGSIGYFEKIAADLDVNGIEALKPIEGRANGNGVPLNGKHETPAQAKRRRLDEWARSE